MLLFRPVGLEELPAHFERAREFLENGDGSYPWFDQAGTSLARIELSSSSRHRPRDRSMALVGRITVSEVQVLPRRS